MHNLQTESTQKYTESGQNYTIMNTWPQIAKQCIYFTNKLNQAGFLPGYNGATYRVFYEPFGPLLWVQISKKKFLERANISECKSNMADLTQTNNKKNIILFGNVYSIAYKHLISPYVLLYILNTIYSCCVFKYYSYSLLLWLFEIFIFLGVEIN